MAEIRIEGVSEELYAKLSRRARIHGISLNDYMLLVCESAAEPSIPDDALERLANLPPHPTAQIISPRTDP